MPESGSATDPWRDEAATVAPDRAPAALAAASAMPGYEILDELGRGGMGVVYRAMQAKLGRVVALKMILAGGHAGTSGLARFRTEAEAIARLQHPNIVQIHEIGEHQGLPYFSLEFCPGGSLADKLRGTPLPPSEAASLVEKLARAMHAAHQKGIIHRDLKPGNVLLTEDGTPKITDFGLAKKLGESGQTQSGAVLGTPSYMAPEQAGGVKELTAAVDIYGLGAVLYACLTGRPPFHAAQPLDTVMQVVSNEPAPPRLLNPQVPRDLETICLKCLEKDPRRRFASAGDLADDLHRFLTGESISARSFNLVDRVIGTLERSQDVGQFTAYGNLFLLLTLCMCIPEIFVTLTMLYDWPPVVLPAMQLMRVTGFLGLVAWYRRGRLLPSTTAERLLWSIWGGYVIACACVGGSMRIAMGLDVSIEGRIYIGVACLTGLAFFATAGHFWGVFYAFGAAFFILAMAMTLDLRWAPLEYGALWAVILVAVGLHLRRLGRTAQTEHSIHAG